MGDAYGFNERFKRNNHKTIREIWYFLHNTEDIHVLLRKYFNTLSKEIRPIPRKVFISHLHIAPLLIIKLLHRQLPS
jgi:hypothetical protein